MLLSIFLRASYLCFDFLDVMDEPDHYDFQQTMTKKNHDLNGHTKSYITDPGISTLKSDYRQMK